MVFVSLILPKRSTIYPISLFCTWIFICMCWIDFQLFFSVVADFFCFKVGYTQCLAIAAGNFFFFGFILMCINLISLETKLLCLLGVIIYDIKNKIRNSRQVPTCILWTYVLSKFSFKIFIFIFLDKWVSGKESNLVRLCWWMTSLQSACFILFWLELF